MKKVLGILLILLLISDCSFAAESNIKCYTVWPGAAPMETEPVTDAARAEALKIKNINFSQITIPVYEVWQPKEKKSDTCIIISPGGGYNVVCYPHEGEKIASFYNSKGITAVILRYRVPRRKNVPKHLAAWQDAQRTVRVIRSRAEELGINPNKIGFTGFSAGGHLTLMTATSSLTPSYSPIDEIDKIPANVNFAVPVYPAYVLKDGEDEPNTDKGNNSFIVKDFAFDEKTPPMCFIHGDNDVYSPMASVTVYHQLRKMNIPAELHIYATVNHGFGGNAKGDHVGDWLNRVWAWMTVMGFGNN